MAQKRRKEQLMKRRERRLTALCIGGGIGEKQYDLGTNRATIPHQTGSTMKPIGAYCLALDYGLINYSS